MGNIYANLPSVRAIRVQIAREGLKKDQIAFDLHRKASTITAQATGLERPQDNLIEYMIENARPQGLNCRWELLQMLRATIPHDEASLFIDHMAKQCGDVIGGEFFSIMRWGLGGSHEGIDPSSTVEQVRDVDRLFELAVQASSEFAEAFMPRHADARFKAKKS